MEQKSNRKREAVFRLALFLLFPGSCEASGYAVLHQYGVHFDTSLRDQVVPRFKSLDLPTYSAGVNPRLTAQFDANGGVTAVHLTYPRDPVDPYLRYASMYGISGAELADERAAAARNGTLGATRRSRAASWARNTTLPDPQIAMIERACRLGPETV